MITAMQAAKLKAANGIKAARDELALMVPLVCMTKENRDALHSAIAKLDAMFAEIISNTSPEGVE